MTDEVISAFKRSFFDTQMVSTRLVLALSEFTWAVLLLWPGDTFGRPTYTGMAAIMTESHWGAVFLATAVMQLAIITRGNFHSREARYFAAFNAALWLFVVGSMLASVYPPPAAISAEIVLSIAAFWIWFRPFLERNIILKARANVRHPL